MTTTVKRDDVLRAARERWPGLFFRVKIGHKKPWPQPTRCCLFGNRAGKRTCDVSVCAPTLAELLAKIEGDK